MGRMLNLLDLQLTQAQHLQEIGRPADALPILRRLSVHRDLPTAAASVVQESLGALYLESRQFRLARRHLARALRLEPTAGTYHLMAVAIESDPEIDARRAASYYRRAIELAPDEPAILADSGAFLVQMGQLKKGLRQLRRAVELAPDDLDVFEALLESLCEAERFDDARRELDLARFRHACKPRFLNLSHDLEFRQLRKRQREAAAPAQAKAPMAVLPFLRVRPAGEKPAKRIVRQDTGSGSHPHFPRVPRHTDSRRSS